MPTALALRTDYDSAHLRDIARCSKNSNQSRRLLSLAAVYDGMNRTEAARIAGQDRQALRRWVLRFNADGPDGLLDRWASGPPRRLNNEQLAELSRIVESGPDTKRHYH